MNPTLVDHFMNPRNSGTLEVFDISVKIGNPVCGDTVEMDIRLDEAAVVDEVRYRAYGCSASLATASLLSEFIKGKNAVMLAAVSGEDIAILIGELAPRERHCRDFASEIIQTITQQLSQRRG